MGIRRPSRETISEARRLGVQMAATDQKIRPDVSGAEQYVSYAQFLLAHRHFIEVGAPFERWDRLLERLAELEEKTQHEWASEPVDWDSFQCAVTEPIRGAFWHGWENAVELQKLFEQRIGQRQKPKADVPVLRVANTPAEHPTGSGLLDLAMAEDLEVRLDDIGLA